MQLAFRHGIAIPLKVYVKQPGVALRTARHMATTKRLTPSKRKGRAAITNGRFLLQGVDHRSRAARRFRDLYHQYLTETGGRYDELCRQAASLVTQREIIDAAIVRGDKVDALHLVRLAGAINRTLAQLKRATVEPETERKRRQREDREAGLIA